MKYGLVLLCVMAGCDSYNGYMNGFDVPPGYDQLVNPNLITPGGIQVDTSDYATDVALLDERVEKTETCILRVMAENPVPDPGWQCLAENYKPEPLKRDYLIIKLVAPVWQCSNWQLLPIPAPDEYCLVKDILPTPQCPCLWRTAIQDENIILTPPPETRPGIPPTSPPAPYLWEIGRMMTSCNDTWHSPFAQCLSY